MAPKAAQVSYAFSRVLSAVCLRSTQKPKVKAEAEPTTPTPQSNTKRNAASPSPGGTPASKKKVKKEVPPSQSLECDPRAAVPIDVTVEGGLVAESVKDGKFGLTLKLEGLSAFTMVKTVIAAPPQPA